MEIRRRQELDDSHARESNSTINETSWISYSAGEASWVSFCRAVEISSGGSMVFDLMKGDADCCPPDLANVPMQLSMRDVITMALMTGMRCTQASFEEKSLSMHGLIGTITSSQHPLLGPLLHFTPRNVSLEEIRDISVGPDVVHSSWIARMWDDVVVAGTRYTKKERIQLLKDALDWEYKLFNRAFVPVDRDRPPSSSSRDGPRHRSSAASTRPKTSVW